MRLRSILFFWIFVGVGICAYAAPGDSWTSSSAEKPDLLPSQAFKPLSLFSASLQLGFSNNDQPAGLGINWISNWQDRRATVFSGSYWTTNHLRLDAGERIQFLQKKWYGNYWNYLVGPKLRAGQITADLIDYQRWELGLGLGWNPAYENYPLYSEAHVRFGSDSWLVFWKIGWMF